MVMILFSLYALHKLITSRYYKLSLFGQKFIENFAIIYEMEKIKAPESVVVVVVVFETENHWSYIMCT